LLAPHVLAQEVVDDYSWADSHYTACADSLLGAHQTSVGKPFSTTSVVTVRALDDHCAERQLILIEGLGTDFHSQAVRVAGASILEQLHALHMSSPGDSAKDLCQKIPVDHLATDPETMTRLRSLLSELNREHFSLLPRNLAIVHGIDLSIWITSGQWTAHFSFTDSRQPHFATPLGKWANSLLATAGLDCQPPPDDARHVAIPGQ
jgi:hypothetical protein